MARMGVDHGQTFASSISPTAVMGNGRRHVWLFRSRMGLSDQQGDRCERTGGLTLDVKASRREDWIRSRPTSTATMLPLCMAVSPSAAFCTACRYGIATAGRSKSSFTPTPEGVQIVRQPIPRQCPGPATVWTSLYRHVCANGNVLCSQAYALKDQLAQHGGRR